MNTDFLVKIAESGQISSSKRFMNELSEFYEHTKKYGLSGPQLQDVMNVVLNIDTSVNIFQNLILCMIPKEAVSVDIIERTLYWILCETGDFKNEQKVVSFLEWIVTLLEFKLVKEEVVDQFYQLLFPLVEYNWKSLYHLMYLLTKVEDVTASKISKIYRAMDAYGSRPYQCALLKHFKDLNSDFAYRPIKLRKTSKEAFDDKSRFVQTLKSNFLTLLQPGNLQTKNMDEKEDIFVLCPTIPPVQKPLDLDSCSVHEIHNGVDLAKKFRRLLLPQNILSLMNSTISIHVLMLSKRSLQEHFLRNLSALLSESLLTGQNSAKTEEVTNLLIHVVQLQRVFQQGFTFISRILALYLESWDGVAYRVQIYDLIEWFVFSSPIELNRFVLLPLYTLFISGSPNEMAEILQCLLCLLKNLYSRLDRGSQKIVDIYEENVIHSRNELIEIIKSLSLFLSELYKIGLFIHPCNPLLLASSIMYYEEIHILETDYLMPWWSLTSSNVVYNCIFSCNAYFLNKLCNLWLKYREIHYVHESDERRDRLSNFACDESNKDKLLRYVEDIFNIFWTAKAFEHRTEGRVFLGLSTDDENSWRKFANLDNSLTLEKHIMLAPYRSLFSYENDVPSNKFTKKHLLKALQKDLPAFAEVLERMVPEE